MLEHLFLLNDVPDDGRHLLGVQLAFATCIVLAQVLLHVLLHVPRLVDRHHYFPFSAHLIKNIVDDFGAQKRIVIVVETLVAGYPLDFVKNDQLLSIKSLYLAMKYISG